MHICVRALELAPIWLARAFPHRLYTVYYTTHNTHDCSAEQSPSVGKHTTALCQALYYNQHVALTINQLYIAKVSFVSPRGLGIIARWPPGPPRGLRTPLRPSTWSLGHLVTSLLMIATTWFGDLSAAAPPRPSTWFRDPSAATPPRPPLRIVPLLVDKVVSDIRYGS
jgi:hypothetical protein